MEARNYIGIVLVVIGTTLIPIGWMFSPVTTLIGFLLFVLGLVIFMTQQYIERSEEAEFSRFGKRGNGGMPTDVHDHSGWGSGGRSEGWSSSHSGSDGGGSI
jgi:uncharacterized membrane protein